MVRVGTKANRMMSDATLQAIQPPPTGIITFLFTDIEGSTRLWEQHYELMGPALARHNALLSGVIEAQGGYLFKTVGDGFYVAFADPEDAVAAAVAGQQAISAEDWGNLPPLHVRMALYTGTAQ